ncbi:phage tail tape measure protein [Ornithobacterium rhinotracheale]|uniref:phage tail tape measure protein n=1 Tax=Ornithobacterium rhinotracheale TaxID=28251 RepID=UPI001FF181CE|nr:phage tail tape measure protein [Ornithobacterium rhinotracheale]MCK0199223.1 phage tail tape measure protein [Ornithobacterium rhinotracheale]
MAQQAKLTLLIDLADKLSGKLGKLEGKVANFQGRMQKKLNSIGDSISKKLGVSTENLKKGLMMGAAAGIAALGTLAVKGVNAAAKFDEAFMPIRQLNLDKSKGTLDEYRAKIREATYEVGTNLTDSTNAIYDLQSATGVFGDDAISIFKKVGKYSVATGANINDAMNSTTKAMKAFGLGVNDIDKLLESNAKTVQTGITTFDELARVQTEYAGAASSAGQGVDTANKIFAMFTSVAKNSDVGATMAKTFFQGMGQQADKFKEVLKINVFDEKGSMRQADDILKDIAGKFKNMSDQQITEAINKIGGPEGLQGALAKVKTGADDMIATFEAFDSSKFNLDDALANAQGDFNKLKELFSNRLEVVMSKIGEAIIPHLLKLFEVLNPALDWLNQNMDWIIPVFGTFAGVLGAVTAAMWLLNSAMFANPVGLIIAGVAALIALVVVAINKFNDWGAGILALLGPIGWLIIIIKKLYDGWDKVKAAFTAGGIMAALKQIGKTLLDAILQPVQQLLEILSYIPGLGHLAGKGASFIEGLRKNLGAIDPSKGSGESKKADDKPTALYGDKETNGGTPILGGAGKGEKTPKVADNVNKVTGASTQAKNITINIEALHKGNNNLSGNDGKRLSMQEYEEMFNEMMMRIIRNAELS